MIIRTILASALFFAVGCTDTDATEGTKDDKESAPLACEEGQTCPIGSSCNGSYCTLVPVIEDAPLACDEANLCSTGFECMDASCVYVLAGADCTEASEEEVCGTGFCMFELEDVCGVGGETGSCTAQLESLRTEEDTVCGCDGDSYWNPDYANFAGVSIQYTGPCGDPEA